MRALISVYDKIGIVDFVQKLCDLDVDIISSGGTFKLLHENNIPATPVEDITGFAECLGGRVKTLHPNIHAGILANREVKKDMQTIESLGISPIDIVVVNLYPFNAIIKNPEHTLADAIENIDIGGPTLIRAAAKNNKSVCILTDSSDYDEFLQRLKDDRIDDDYRFNLAKKAFKHTADYDLTISNYLLGINSDVGAACEYPDIINLKLTRKQNLRYGENPHQSAAYYVNNDNQQNGIENAKLINGKELSYNNINDTQGAIALAMEFSEPVCVAVKHATPCGVAVSENIADAFKKAFDCDPVSIFGGIICFNREVDIETAKLMHEVFLEVIIAPSFSDDALDLLSQKKNLRLLVLHDLNNPQILPNHEYKGVGGGFLVQESDIFALGNDNKAVTKTTANPEDILDMEFGMKVVKHVKSNAIVVVKNGATIGIGGGEVSRIWAADAALSRAGEKTNGAVVASDAFFPFADVVETCAEHNISAIIQPGGSKNDQLSVDACDKYGISMVFTGMRHFKH